MGLSVEFSTSKARKEVEDLLKSLDKLESNLSNVKKRIETISKTALAMGKAFKEAGNELASKQYSDFSKELVVIVKNLDNTKSGLQGLGQQSKASAEGLKATGKEAENLNVTLGELNEKEKENTKSQKDNQAQLDKTQKKFQELSKKILELREDYKKLLVTSRENQTSLLKATNQVTKQKIQLDKSSKVIADLKDKNQNLANANNALGASFQNAANKVKELEKEVKASNAALLKQGKVNLDLQKTASKLGNQNEALNHQLAKSKKEVTLLTNSMKALETRKNSLEDQTKRLSKANKDLAALSKQLKVSQSYLKEELRKATADMKKAENQAKKLEAQNKRLEDSNKRLKESVKKNTAINAKMMASMQGVMKAASTLRNTLLILTTLMVWKRLSDDILKVGADFEMAMKRVGGATETITKGWESMDFKSLTNKVLELGETTEYTSLQVAESAKNLAMVGFMPKQIEATLGGVLDLATAGQIDLAAAADLATAALTTMGLVTADTAQLEKNLTRVNNALVFSAVQTNVSVQDLAESFKYAAPQARSTGLEIEELTTWLGVLGNAGIKGCYDEETEVLTEDGWKKWRDVTNNDVFATVNPKNNEFEYKKSVRIIKYHHTGKMYKVLNQNIDLLVTPNHRMYIKKRGRDRFDFYRADEVFGGVEHKYLKASSIFSGHDRKIKIQGLSQYRGSWTKEVDDVYIDQDVMAEFLGYYLSEGSCTKDDRGNYRVSISQIKEGSRNKIRNFLKKFPFKFTEDKKSFTCRNQQLFIYVSQFGKSYNKFIPQDVKNMKKENLKILLSALILGDGTFHPNGKSAQYTTSSPRLLDDIQEICFKLGASANSKIAALDGDETGYIRGRLICARRTIYHIDISFKRETVGFSRHEYSENRKKRFAIKSNIDNYGEKWVDYDGMVYCAEVPPNHTLVVRRNGKVICCGNSSAGTQLAFAFMRQGKALKELGLSAKHNNFLDMLKEMNKKGWGSDEVNQIFTIRGSRAVLLLKNMIPVYERLIEVQKESAEYAKDLADVFRESIATSILKMKSALENVKIEGFTKSSYVLKESFENLHKTINKNRGTLVDLASGFQILLAKMNDFVSGSINALTKLVQFYERNKGLMDALLLGGAVVGGGMMLGGMLVPGGILAGASIATYTILNAATTDADSIKVLTQQVEENQKQIDILKEKREKLNKSYESNKKIREKDEKFYSFISFGLAKDKIKKDTEEMNQTFKEQDNALERSLKEITKRNKKLEEALKTLSDPELEKQYQEKMDKDIIKRFSEQLLFDTKGSLDALNSSLENLSQIEDRIDELSNFGGKIGEKTKDGGLKYVGGPSLETQQKLARKRLNYELEDISLTITSLQKQKEEAKRDLLEAEIAFRDLGDRPPVSAPQEEREAWEVLNEKYQAAVIKTQNFRDAANNREKELIVKRQELLLSDSMFSRQIQERNYNNLKQGLNAVKSANDTLFNLRKESFENYQRWTEQAFSNLLTEEIDTKIKDQQDKITDMIKTYQLTDPDKRMPLAQHQKSVEIEKKSLDLLKERAKAEKEITINREKETKRREFGDYTLEADNRLNELKKRSYETFEQWKVDTSLKYKKIEIGKEIEAQKELIARMEADHKNYIDKSTDDDYQIKKDKQDKILEYLETSAQGLIDAEENALNLTLLNRNEAIKNQTRSLEDQIFDIKKENALKLDIFTNKNAVQYAKEDLERAVKLENEKRDLWLKTERLKSASDPSKMTEEEVTKQDTAWLKLIELLEKSGLIKIEEMTKVTFEDIGQKFKDVVEDSISNTLTDAITGQLDSIREYFSSFVNSLGSMWSQMVAKMVMEQKTLGDFSAMQSVGMMGLAGAGIFAASSVLSSIEKRKAEKKRKKQIREQLETELTDSIAKLELGDVGYQIYQLQERIDELTKSAKYAGYPMEKIIKLRELETKAILESIRDKYKSQADKMYDYIQGIIREDWSIFDWKAEFDRLSGEIEALDWDDTNFAETAIDLLDDQFEALKKIHEIQKNQLNALESLNKSLASQIWDLRHSDKMPTSLDDFNKQYQDLLIAARTPDKNDFINTEAVQEFQDFVDKYLDVFSAAGYDYQDLINSVTGDLGDLQIEVKNEYDELTKAIKANTNALEGNEGVINAINRLAKITMMVAYGDIGSAAAGLAPEAIITSDREARQKGGLVSAGLHVSDALKGYHEAFGRRWEISYNEASVEENIRRSFMKAYDKASSIEAWYKGIPSDVLDLHGVKQMPIIDYSESAITAAYKTTNSYQGIEKYIEESFQNIMDWYDEAVQKLKQPLFDLGALGMPKFAKGGLATQPSIAGESGSEWVVPSFNNPNNSNFLKSVGVDSNVIGNQIGNIVANKLSQALSSLSLNQNAKGDIVVQINEREIARAVISQSKKNPELARVMH